MHYWTILGHGSSARPTRFSLGYGSHQIGILEVSSRGTKWQDDQNFVGDFDEVITHIREKWRLPYLPSPPSVRILRGNVWSLRGCLPSKIIPRDVNQAGLLCAFRLVEEVT